MMNKLFLVLFLAISCQLQAQSDKDAQFIKTIYDNTLSKGQSYEWLRTLTKEAGPRLAGSEAAQKAVELMKGLMDTIGFDTVYLQACEVPHWERGGIEIGYLVDAKGQKEKDLNILALGNTVGTGDKGILGEIIEVRSLDEVHALKDAVKDKIVFYNRPMDPTHIQTFHAYGGAVDQRVFGAAVAGKYGAKGVIVRSLTTLQDDTPHTGTNAYDPEVKPIPAFAISTNDANYISGLLQKKTVSIFLKNNAQILESSTSYNVIGEIKGSTNPEEIILVGGHLDSWDVGEGAHDDGAGCVQSMEVIYNLLQLNYTPKRTLRCVLFMNEENGLAGGITYAAASNDKGEFHLAALESDSGGFTPRSFAFEADKSVQIAYGQALAKYLPFLEPYGMNLSPGGSGADIGPLKVQKGLLLGLKVDSQRYFDLHHSKNDTFDQVNERELKLGAAAMTSLIYLIDMYGL